MPYNYKKVGDKYAVYKKSNGELVGKTEGNKTALRKYLNALYLNANENINLNELFNNIPDESIKFNNSKSIDKKINPTTKTKEYNLNYKGNKIKIYIFINKDKKNKEIYNISFSINDRNDFVNVNKKHEVTIIQIINYICTFIFKIIEKHQPDILNIEHDNIKLLKIIEFICNKNLLNSKSLINNNCLIVTIKNKKKLNENISNNMNKLTIEEKTFINEQVAKSINNELMVHEAEHKGKKVTLNKPKRNPQGSKKKFHVYVKNEKGNIIKVQFGDPNMKIKRNIPSRKKAYRARHHCDNPGPKTKANYWSCQYGWGNKAVSKVIGESDEKLLEEYIRNEVKKILNSI